MFIKRIQLIGLQRKIERLEQFKSNIVACSKCGCLLNKNNATEGQPYIDYYFEDNKRKRRIIDIYYCRIHIPKYLKDEQ